MKSLENLLYLMTRLRDPQSGCPWDLQQDFKSIVPHTLEECYELADTIEREDFSHLREELGDVLFQVVFYCQLGQEQELFGFDQVAQTLVDKLVRRHPHVFPDGTLRGKVADASPSEATIVENWERIKQREREEKARPGLLADIPLALPALTRARKLQKRASRVGFDWSGAAAVMDKVREETDELQEDIERGNPRGIEEELGDLLFSVVNLARHLKVDPETALRQANRKFERRFSSMEAELAAASRSFDGLTEEQMNRLWEAAKGRTAGDSNRE